MEKRVLVQTGCSPQAITSVQSTLHFLDGTKERKKPLAA